MKTLARIQKANFEIEDAVCDLHCGSFDHALAFVEGNTYMVDPRSVKPAPEPVPFDDGVCCAFCNTIDGVPPRDRAGNHLIHQGRVRYCVTNFGGVWLATEHSTGISKTYHAQNVETVMAKLTRLIEENDHEGN